MGGLLCILLPFFGFCSSPSPSPPSAPVPADPTGCITVTTNVDTVNTADITNLRFSCSDLFSTVTASPQGHNCVLQSSTTLECKATTQAALQICCKSVADSFYFGMTAQYVPPSGGGAWFVTGQATNDAKPNPNLFGGCASTGAGQFACGVVDSTSSVFYQF